MHITWFLIISLRSAPPLNVSRSKLTKQMQTHFVTDRTSTFSIDAKRFKYDINNIKNMICVIAKLSPMISCLLLTTCKTGPRQNAAPCLKLIRAKSLPLSKADLRPCCITILFSRTGVNHKKHSITTCVRLLCLL